MQCPRSSHSAFTLIELLVVIAIIGLLAGVFVVGMRDKGSSALRNATDIVALQLNAARMRAIFNNGVTRMLIEKSDAEQTGNRRMGIVSQSINATTGEVTWERISPWVTLPQGTYIVQDEEIPHSTKTSGATAPDTDFFDGKFDGKTWAYYEFSSTGACDTNAGARIIIAAGRYVGNQWTRPNKSLIQGLFLTRLGNTVYFESPTHINNSFTP